MSLSPMSLPRSAERKHGGVACSRAAAIRGAPAGRQQCRRAHTVIVQKWFTESFPGAGDE